MESLVTTSVIWNKSRELNLPFYFDWVFTHTFRQINFQANEKDTKPWIVVKSADMWEVPLTHVLKRTGSAASLHIPVASPAYICTKQDRQYSHLMLLYVQLQLISSHALSKIVQ
jgi:hypothetical protein